MWQFNIDKFGAVIEVWQQSNEISTEELSQLTGVPKSSLYQMKKGELCPQMAQFMALCNVMSFSPETFFKTAKKVV